MSKTMTRKQFENMKQNIEKVLKEIEWAGTSRIVERLNSKGYFNEKFTEYGFSCLLFVDLENTCLSSIRMLEELQNAIGDEFEVQIQNDWCLSVWRF